MSGTMMSFNTNFDRRKAIARNYRSLDFKYICVIFNAVIW
jgi:hypothetical protein